MLLCAFALLSRSWIGERRREIRLIWALAQALERMGGVIRWQKLPLPRVLEESGQMPGGEYFREITEYVKGGMTLQIAWQKAFEEFLMEENKQESKSIDELTSYKYGQKRQVKN